MCIDIRQNRVFCALYYQNIANAATLYDCVYYGDNRLGIIAPDSASHVSSLRFSSAYLLDTIPGSKINVIFLESAGYKGGKKKKLWFFVNEI
jgi:hypothetical protein